MFWVTFSTLKGDFYSVSTQYLLCIIGASPCGDDGGGGVGWWRSVT